MVWVNVVIWSLAFAVSFASVRLAASRSAAQPFPIDRASERAVVGGARDEWRSEASPLLPEMFTDSDLSQQWARYLSGEEPGDERDPSLSKEEWLDAGSRVITAAADRDLLSGRGSTTIGDGGVPHRVPTPVTGARYFFAASTVLVSAAVMLWANTSWVVNAVAAVLVLCAVVISLVDWDTLYVDMPTLGVASGVAVVGIAAGWGTGSGLALFSAGVLVASIAVTLLLYRLLRGVVGMAMGDVVLLFPFVVAPAVFLALPSLVFASFFAALLLSLLGYVATHRKGKEVPFAFGPYVAFGWVLGLAGVLMFGL